MKENKENIVKFAEFMGGKGYKIMIVRRGGKVGAYIGPISNKELRNGFEEFRRMGEYV